MWNGLIRLYGEKMPMQLHPKMDKERCHHFNEFKVAESDKKQCEVCGDKEHLRLCTSCGKVFCCESHNAHDTEHFKKTDHPIIKAMHCNYDFIWCYKCNAYLE